MESNTAESEVENINNENEIKEEDGGKQSATEDDNNEISLTRPSLGSDADYDDDLEVSDSIKIVDMGDGPVAIENSEDEPEGTDNFSFHLQVSISLNISRVYLGLITVLSFMLDFFIKILFNLIV